MKTLTYILLLICITCFYTDLIAQVSPGQVPPPPPQNPPAPVPITGVEYLIIGGAAYGIYRFSKKKNKSDNA